MIDDTLEVDEDSELEEEADEEVDKVLYELTDGKLGQAGTVQDTLPVRSCNLTTLAFHDTLVFQGTGGTARGRRQHGGRDATHAARTTRSLNWIILPIVVQTSYRYYCSFSSILLQLCVDKLFCKVLCTLAHLDHSCALCRLLEHGKS